MTPISLIILYAGLGLAMTLLRRRQGVKPAAALLAGLAWPLEIAAGCLDLLGSSLATLPASGGETNERCVR